LRKGTIRAIDAISGTALAVPRVDRVPPLRCSQFAATMWHASHSNTRRVTRSQIALTRDASCAKDSRD